MSWPHLEFQTMTFLNVTIKNVLDDKFFQVQLETQMLGQNKRKCMYNDPASPSFTWLYLRLSKLFLQFMRYIHYEKCNLLVLIGLHSGLGAGLKTTSQVLLSITSHFCLISVLIFLTCIGLQSSSVASSHSSLVLVSKPVTSHVSSLAEAGTENIKVCFRFTWDRTS